MKICLDPGHYGKYNSGIIKGYYESEMNLKLAYKLKEKLEKYGAKVFLTRTGTEDLSLYSRGQVAVKNDCDVFFSIHSNARSGDETHRGVVVYYSIFQPEHKGLMEELGRAAAEAMGSIFQGALTRKGNNGNWDYNTVIKSAVDGGVPMAFLVEHGYHTNREDCAALMKDEVLEKIAEAEAGILAEHFGLVQEEQEGENGGSMRTFETLMDMNFRAAPNGTKLDLISKGERLTGEVKVSGSVGWLYTAYNGKSGCVAVLPESRGYAKEIISSQPDNPSEDYKALYEQTAQALISAQSDLKSVTAERDELKDKLEQIKKLAG